MAWKQLEGQTDGNSYGLTVQLACVALSMNLRCSLTHSLAKRQVAESRWS